MSRTKAQMEMYKLQDTIRNNTTALHTSVHDVVAWSNEANVKEKKAKKEPAP
jgi:hypothetical protein